jgi:hypothetical protein
MFAAPHDAFRYQRNHLLAPAGVASSSAAVRSAACSAAPGCVTPIDVTLVERRNFREFEPLVYQVATDGQRTPGQGLRGPQVVQVPKRVVVARGTHPNEPFAVINEQPDAELDAGPARLGRRRRNGDRHDQPTWR